MCTHTSEDDNDEINKMIEIIGKAKGERETKNPLLLVIGWHSGMLPLTLISVFSLHFWLTIVLFDEKEAANVGVWTTQ